MKKNLTKGRIISYIIYLALACTLVFGITYARYSSKVTGNVTAKTASVEMNSTINLTDQLGGMTPGSSKKIEFEVTNKKERNVSEVGQEYSITIDTTGNLPLTYTIAGDSAAPASEKYVTAVEESSGETNYKWTGGVLPYSADGITHTYTLTVTWPKSGDEDNSAYSDEIDQVTLTVDAKQIEPKAGS